MNRSTSNTRTKLIIISIIIGTGLVFQNFLGGLLFAALSPIVHVVKSGEDKNSPSVLSQQDREELLQLRLTQQLYNELSKKYVVGATSSAERILTKSALIVTRPSSSPYGTVLIGAGVNEGIKEGDLVGFGNTVLYGRVIEVYKTSSKIMPYTRAGETIKGFIRGTLPVELIGQGGGSFVFLTPLQDAVVKGDLILSDSGLLIGEVKEVRKKEDSTQTEVLVTSPFSIFNYQFLNILKERTIVRSAPQDEGLQEEERVEKFENDTATTSQDGSLEVLSDQ